VIAADLSYRRFAILPEIEMQKSAWEESKFKFIMETILKLILLR
jgi:hypothetical protein